jgi:hypothetical protein
MLPQFLPRLLKVLLDPRQQEALGEEEEEDLSDLRLV